MATLEIRFNPDNSIAIRIPSGVSFETAKSKIEGLVKILGTDVPIKLEGQVEQHRHEPTGAGAHHTH